MLFSGAWRKKIHEKNLKQKSRDTVPLTSQCVFGQVTESPGTAVAAGAQAALPATGQQDQPHPPRTVPAH